MSFRMASSNKQFLFIPFLRVLGFREIVKGLGAKVLTETFWTVFFGITFRIWGWVLGREVCR